MSFTETTSVFVFDSVLVKREILSLTEGGNRFSAVVLLKSIEELRQIKYKNETANEVADIIIRKISSFNAGSSSLINEIYDHCSKSLRWRKRATILNQIL